ncbi:nitrogen fixation-related uncharacterized protein [Bradyrhizobium sp. LB9.1b]
MSHNDPGQFDPATWIKRLTESYSSVRFPRGVVGKTTHAMLGLIALWALILWGMSENLTKDAALLGAGLVITGVFIWWVKTTQAFAERNPAQAMLDGAEFIEYKKFEAQAKGLPPSVTVLTSDPGQPPPALDAPGAIADDA